jgi:hypothetical protein
MPLSVVPRIKKTDSCDVCNNRKLTGKMITGKMFPLEYSMTSLPECFPRRVLMLNRQKKDWKSVPDVLTVRRSVGVVCRIWCLFECERAKYPVLNTLLDKIFPAGLPKRQEIPLIQGGIQQNCITYC